MTTYTLLKHYPPLPETYKKGDVISFIRGIHCCSNGYKITEDEAKNHPEFWENNKSNPPHITKIHRPGGNMEYQVRLSTGNTIYVPADKVIDSSGDSIMNPTWIKTEEFTYRINQKPIKNEANKPPLGLRPRKVIEEERLFEINQAIKRYVDVNKKIPREWIDEYYEIMEKLYG